MIAASRIPVRAACAVLLLATAACESAPLAVPADGSSPTGGMCLQLWYARLDTKQYEFFRVGADGSLGYGGGMKAFDRQVEWTGALTAEEASRVRAIVDAAGWMTAASPGKKTAETPLAEVSVGNGTKERNFSLQGPDEAVLRIAETLGKAANRRFDRYMERLPDAGVQPRR